MPERQLDLFGATGVPPAHRPQPDPGRHELVAGSLDDAALVAAIARADLTAAAALADEAGRRRLAAAVPALERLCRRFAGFGLERPVPEQVAGLEALARIGGPAAAQAVSRLIVRRIVQGPTRKVALNVAARLGSALPAATVLALLQDADPKVRADACRCAEPGQAVLQVLLELADDADGSVRVAAACALGRMGRRESRPALVRLLGAAPSVEVIDAVPAIADEDCIVLLGRLVRTRPGLAGAARDALERIDHPRARQIVATTAPGETSR